MNTSLQDAIKEAYALAPSNVVIYETLEIRHPLLTPSLFLVKSREDITATLETSVVQLFTATAFRLALPSAGDNGLQELTISVDNVDRRVSDFVDLVRNSTVPVEVLYRPYLSTDLTEPQMVPPLSLFMTDVTINVYEVTIRCSFADLINKRFPSQLYTRARFPSLGD